MAGKVVLVAGGTGGLGRAVSLAFVEAGARVIVTFQRPGDLDYLKSAASAKLVAVDGASLDGYNVDVTDEAAVAKLIDGIVERHGRLDCLVNAVGGYAGGTKL
jgi:NAD(P)-dependent dehydrogenase (short-subunit alcohol dehydrogenase family)